MNRKPWSIVLCALIFLLIPFGNIYYTYLFMDGNYDFSDYIYSLFTLKENFWILFNLIVPSIIASISVYSIKNWSIPVFLSSMLWIIASSIMDLASHASIFKSMIVIAVPIILNSLFVYFILIPNVRMAYLNPKLRWWESKPRFIINKEAKVIIDSEEQTVTVSNISEGGVFVISEKEIDMTKELELHLDILEFSLKIKAKTVYQIPNKFSYGLQFNLSDSSTVSFVKKCMKSLRKNNYPETRVQEEWKKDFSKWFITLLKTGKGLVPQIPQKK